MFAQLSIEELLDLEDDIRSDFDEGCAKDGDLHKLIRVYEELYKKIRRDKNSEYTGSLPTIEERLITSLVDYGTYMKTIYQKDDQAAETSLKKALKYNRSLPVVHYRLGFLSYKQGAYASALNYFQNALHYQKSGEEMDYKMEQQQLYHCHLYLANCGLFIATNANEALADLKHEGRSKPLSNYELSPLYRLINDNEQYLKDHACQMVTNQGIRFCSKDTCDDAVEAKNTVILDFTGREDRIIFNGQETVITKNRAELLRFFLLHSKEEAPVTKYDVYDLFAKADASGEIPTNTFTKQVGRLRGKLADAGIGGWVIENKAGAGEATYYYNHFYPFLILQWSDESFIL